MLRACRCTTCGEPALANMAEDWDRDEVLAHAIECRSCGATFDVIWGVPFLGHYEQGDIAGLIEIAANARADNHSADRNDIARLESLLRRAYEAGGRAKFRSGSSDDFVRAPWFGNRYAEYAEFRLLSKEIDFVDRDVLDVGAGSGYDAWRLVQAGGRVTALEYNPVLIRRGMDAVPEARWVGGFSHALPFENESFDIVCCNAALHHMRDVRSAMQEMLRVLRTGGWLLTTGDPFRADGSGEQAELELLDRHPDALLGINESIPTFADYVATLVANEDRLDVVILATLTGARDRLARRVRRRRNLSNQVRELSESTRLADRNGSLSIRAQTRSRLGLSSAKQGPTVLRAGDYANVLDNYDDAVAALLDLLPASFVDSPFPGEQQTKFELLNGWQKPQPGSAERTGYKRARWFLNRPAHAHALLFRVRANTTRRVGARFHVRVPPDSEATIVSVGSAWSEISIALNGIPPATRFVCELRLELADESDTGFDDYCFAVKDRAFV
jgi:ubiquinone/menaquinone biosynthesis C-methylase UbiE